MRQEIAQAIFDDCHAGEMFAALVPRKTTRGGKRATVYRWVTERGDICDGLRRGLDPDRMFAHAKAHPAFRDVRIVI